MILKGVYKGSKSGSFQPEGESESYPYLFAKVADGADPDGGYVKVKPNGDLDAFKAVLAGIHGGDTVDWDVFLDKYGNLRFLGQTAVNGK